MKWLVRGFFAVSVLVGAALIGGLFLPSRAHVERTISIDRPPSTVFTLLSSLKTFHDWSPWSAREPDAVFAFEGPDFGEGARYFWSGDTIGRGEMMIVGVEPYASVETSVDLDARGRATMVFGVEAKPGGAIVTWTYDADFGFDLIGRYAGRWFDMRLGPEFEAGLLRLKAQAESLPGADFADVDAELVTVAPVQAVIAEREVRGGVDDQEIAFALALSEVRSFMAANELAAAGPAVAVTLRWEPPLWRFEAAVPYTGDRREGTDEAGAVRFGQLPGGQAVRAVHVGPPEGVAPLSTKLEAYLLAHRLAQAGPSWEVRVSDRETTEPVEQVTELYVPIE